MESDSTHRTLISLEDVWKIYRASEVETHALSGICLEIKLGEFVSVAGPSGCGKSTLLAIMGLLEEPTAGTYRFNGESHRKMTRARRATIRNKSIGFVFQAFNLINELTIYENVELPLTFRRVPARERRERVERALDRTGISSRKRHYPSQLAGGQQQRTAVARAIVGDPMVILADEPTGNLDSRNGRLVIDLLGELHSQGTTVCMVTHDPRYGGVADRIISMFDGNSS